MTVKITLTIAGADTSLFSIYSNLDFVVPLETNVNKGALQAGYTVVNVPDTATVIRVKSTGNCVNYIDIPLLENTSSTTSSSTSNTSTTTITTTGVPVAFYHIAGPFATGDDACPVISSFPINVKSFCLLLGVGCIVYTLFNVPFAGGGNWYKEQLSGVVFQVNGTGVITGVFPC